MALAQRYSLRDISGIHRVLDIHAIAAVRVAGLRGWYPVPRIVPDRTAAVGFVYVQLR